MEYEFLLSSLKLPVLNGDYGFDLDGSGSTTTSWARPSLQWRSKAWTCRIRSTKP